MFPCLVCSLWPSLSAVIFARVFLLYLGPGRKRWKKGSWRRMQSDCFYSRWVLRRRVVRKLYELDIKIRNRPMHLLAFSVVDCRNLQYHAVKCTVPLGNTPLLSLTLSESPSL